MTVLADRARSIGATAATLDSALESIDAVMARAHIPGVQLAVVRAGEALFAGGLGRCGAADAAPAVTATTRFAHGSCGKAYAGLLGALLAADGAVDLDAPVRSYVPELRLPDPVVAERVTLRDLLSHRSGLGRHDLIWILDASVSRADLVRRLEFLPLAGDLRNQWSYSNLGFALAGHAMERATRQTYDALLRERVFGPLGMARTTVTLPEVFADGDRAEPHVVRAGVAVATQWRQDAAIAPAGGVVSTAADAVRWLSAQLGDDVAFGPAARATQRITTPVPASLSPFPEIDFAGYGLGWVVGTYRDRPLAWHNGGVDGFATQTLLLPRDGIGIVASANVLDTATTLGMVLLLADLLLGAGSRTDWFDRLAGAHDRVEPAAAGERPAAAPGWPISAYAGIYRHPGYGDIVVDVAGGQLSVRLLGSEVAARHRGHETWELRYEPLEATYPLTFASGPDGTITEAVAPLDDATSPVRFQRVAREESGR